MGAPLRFFTAVLSTLGLTLGLAVSAIQAAEGPDAAKLRALADGPTQPALASGQAMFSGNLGPVAHMSGHASTLPVAASRCSNCHEDRQKAGEQKAERQQLASSEISSRSFAPPLTRASLTEASNRRGGPAMRYDAASFCKLLREGVDPTWIVINTAMPRYRASDAQCSALWTYLMTRPQGQGS
jgi:hypothetical protein